MFGWKTLGQSCFGYKEPNGGQIAGAQWDADRVGKSEWEVAKGKITTYITQTITDSYSQKAVGELSGATCGSGGATTNDHRGQKLPKKDPRVCDIANHK